MELSSSASLVMSNALAREGLSRILSDGGFAISQSVSIIDEISEYYDNSNHVIIIDYSLGHIDIETDIRNIMARFPKSKTIILHDDFDTDVFLRIFLAGVHGYIMKNIGYQAFIANLRLVLMNEKVAPSDLIDTVCTMLSKRGMLDQNDQNFDFGLNDREENILQRLVMGQPNKLISRELDVSESTVKVSIQSIFRKMCVNNRTQAAIMAKKNGFLLHLSALFFTDLSATFLHLF